MATRKLLVLINNIPGELPIGDDVDLSFQSNFSYDKITSSLTIPINQQMVVCDRITIEGALTIEGRLCLI